MSVEALISTQVIDTTTVGRALMTAVDATGARTTLGLGSLATQSGTFSGTSSGTNTGDQTIALTGDVTGTGTGSFAATIGALKVTNAMLAGSIAASNLVGTDIATLGTVTAGTLSTGAVIGGVTVTVGSDATGDIYYRNASGVFNRLGIGSAAQVLTVSGGLPAWAASSGLSGTGAVDNAILRADGTGGATLQSSAFTIADLATASPNNTVNNVSMAPTGGTTNVSLSIVPKGTGAFCLAVPDGTSAGGNVRGANAVDLQTSRSAATQVASGASSFTAGINNTASGVSAFAAGEKATASGQGAVSFGGTTSGIASGASSFVAAMRSGTCSGDNAVAFCRDGGLHTGVRSFSHGEVPGHGSGNVTSQAAVGFSGAEATAETTFSVGYYAQATRYGQKAFANGSFVTSSFGQAQFVIFILRRKTTDATATTLMLDGSTTRLTIPSGKMMLTDILISGIKSDGSAAACYKRKVAIKNVAGTTALVGTVETIGTDIEDNAGTDVAITADDTNDALQINVTGIAAETWRWVAVVEGLEIAYGT